MVSIFSLKCFGNFFHGGSSSHALCGISSDKMNTKRKKKREKMRVRNLRPIPEKDRLFSQVFTNHVKVMALSHVVFFKIVSPNSFTILLLLKNPRFKSPSSSSLA